MASLRALPALKAGTLEAAIFIFSPVWGFLPSLALRSRTENFPKPVILTSSPPLSASVTTLSKAPEVPLGLALWHPGLLRDPLDELPLVHGGSSPAVFCWCSCAAALGCLPEVYTGARMTCHHRVPGEFGRMDPVGG